MSPLVVERVDVAGVPVDPVSMAEAVNAVQRWIRGQDRRVAVGVNAHVVNLAATDGDLAARLQRVDLAYPDGQSVVWACRLLGAAAPERVATTDLIHPLAAMCAGESAGMYFFGGRPGVAARAASRLRDREPTLRIDVHHGYIDPAETPAIIEDINASGAAVLLVGLGDPLQQHWVAQHRAELRPPVVLTCGGLFDWVSGDNRRPPDWIVRAGLEWSWRLLHEPRRLARRYLVGNPAFVARVVAAQLVRQRV